MSEHSPSSTLLFELRDEARRIWGNDIHVRLSYVAEVGSGPMSATHSLMIFKGDEMLYEERHPALEFGTRILWATLDRLRSKQEAVHPTRVRDRG